MDEQKQLKSLQFMYTSALVLSTGIATTGRIGNSALVPFTLTLVQFFFCGGLTFMTFQHKSSILSQVMKLVCVACFGLATICNFISGCLFFSAENYKNGAYMAIFSAVLPILIGGFILFDPLGSFFNVKLGGGASSGGSGVTSNDNNLSQSLQSTDVESTKQQ